MYPFSWGNCSIMSKFCHVSPFISWVQSLPDMDFQCYQLVWLNFGRLFRVWCGTSFLCLVQIFCNIKYMFLRGCKDRTVSSVPRYLSLCWKSSASGNLGSRPNIMKNGLSLECSLGRKLYAAVAVFIPLPLHTGTDMFG